MNLLRLQGPIRRQRLCRRRPILQALRRLHRLRWRLRDPLHQMTLSAICEIFWISSETKRELYGMVRYLLTICLMIYVGAEPKTTRT